MEVLVQQKQVGGRQVVHQAVRQRVVDHVVVEAVLLKLEYDAVKNGVVHSLNFTHGLVFSQTQAVLHPRMTPDLLDGYALGRILHQDLARVTEGYRIRSLNSADSFTESGKPNSASMISLWSSGMLLALKGIVPVTIA